MLKPHFFLKLIWLAGLFWIGCGKQGSPLAPRVEIPETITDLSATQVGDSVNLRWTLPIFAIDGEQLTRPLGIEIFRIFLRKGQVLSGKFEEEDTPWATLDSADLAALGKGFGGLMQWADSFGLAELVLASEGKFQYAVRASTPTFGGRRRKSEFSNLVSLRVLPVSGPVTQLRAESTESSVRLEWIWESGSKEANQIFRGFQVFRSVGGEVDFHPYAETLEPRLEDSKFQFGLEVRYKVRAKFGDGKYVSTSKDSLPVSITPADVFPPRAPRGLVGLYSSQAIELIWNPNSEVDLAGYYVYRREGSGVYRRLTLEVLPTPIYRDTTIVEGRTYSYRVTGLDIKKNESLDSDILTLVAE